MKSALLILAAASIGLAGCNSSSDDYVPPETPKVEFKGTPDPRFVGTWKDKTSTYQLNKDGSYTLKTTVATPSGTMNTESKGSWTVSDDRFLIRDPQGNVVPFKFELQGNKLTFEALGTMKNRTELTKQ